jgi:hypothetical protein
VIASCARRGQSPRVASDLTSDVAAAREWWATVSPSMSVEARGLWFGITDLVTASGAAEHTLYVGGTPTFDADDGGDWACNYVWTPGERYLRLPGLAAIALRDWQAALDHAVKVVAAVEPWSVAPDSLAGVGVGFDDGDVLIVWTRP